MPCKVKIAFLLYERWLLGLTNVDVWSFLATDKWRIVVSHSPVRSTVFLDLARPMPSKHAISPLELDSDLCILELRGNSSKVVAPSDFAIGEVLDGAYCTWTALAAVPNPRLNSSAETRCMASAVCLWVDRQ